MVKFRKDLILVDGLSWLISFPCCLRVLNSLLKDICKDDIVASIISGIRNWLHFLLLCIFWLESVRNWVKDNNVTKGLTTQARTRWYSMSQVCLCEFNSVLWFQSTDCITYRFNPINQLWVQIKMTRLKNLEYFDWWRENHHLCHYFSA